MAFASSIRSPLQLWTALLLLAAPALASQPVTDEEQVVEAVRLLYVAATEDDLELFRRVATPDFYAFDLGQRYRGDELMEVVKRAHAAGKIYVWKVTEPEVHLEGSSAWITYVNRGSLEDAAGKRELSWLESAVLRKEDGGWRIRFLHSTRVPSE